MKINNFLFAAIVLCIVGICIWFLNDKFSKTKEVTKIHITIPQTAYSIPTIIAIEKNFFQENNIDVSVNYVKTGKIALDDLLAGKTHFANIVETNVAFAGFNNPEIKVLCNIAKVYDAAIVARRDKGISTESDLKGKKIGVMLATTSQVFAEWFLENRDIAIEAVTMINLMPPAMQSAIIEGSGVDAVSLWQPFVSNVQKALGENAITFKDKKIFTGYMNLAGNNQTIEKNPEIVEGMLKAYIKAEAFLVSNKAESIKILSKVLSLDKTILEDIWQEYEFEISMNKGLLDATVTEGQWIIKTQENFQTKQLPDYSNFFDASFLEKVDKSRVNW